MAMECGRAHRGHLRQTFDTKLVAEIAADPLDRKADPGEGGIRHGDVPKHPAVGTLQDAVQDLLLPGSGGSVAMLGCLAGHAVRRVAEPVSIRIALHVTGSMSRGSAVTATENMTAECLRLTGGRLVVHSPRDLRDFDFGKGPRSCFPVTLPDLLTIHRSTSVADIETYVHVSGDAFPQGDLSALPDGPTADQRKANRYQAAVEVTAADGTVVHSVLDTVNGYTFTPLAAAEAARRVLSGEGRPGYQTPAGLFGDGFAETIADTRIVDL